MHTFPLLPPFFPPKDQNKLCAHYKNRKHAELWEKNLFIQCICNVCIRFGTWKGSTYETKSIFCRCIRQARPIRKACRPKYKSYYSAEPNWFKRRTLHVPNLIVRFGTCKIRRLNRASLSLFGKIGLNKQRAEENVRNVSHICVRCSRSFKPLFLQFQKFNSGSSELSNRAKLKHRDFS